MQMALDFAFYVMGITFLVGVVMVAWLLRDLLFHGRFRTPLPQIKRVPTTALDSARNVLGRLKGRLRSAPPAQHEEIAYEIRHLEHRISLLEDKTYMDQAEYYAVVKARERVWREWRQLHGAMDDMARDRRNAARIRLRELQAEFQKLGVQVEEEYHRAVARDGLTREELQSQGVLNPEVLNTEQPQTGPAAPPEAAPDAVAGAANAADAASERPTAPQRLPSNWPGPLPTYTPAAGGYLSQSEALSGGQPRSERTYLDATFSMSGLPNGVLSGADFSLSSFGEVVFQGVLRFLNCTFIGTDLRRIVVNRTGSPHQFQGCNFQGALLGQSRIVQAVFNRCNLSNTHWKGATLDHIRFEQCRIDNVHWEGVDLGRTVMSADMLEQADFSAALRPPHNLATAVPAAPVQTAAPEQPHLEARSAEIPPPIDAAAAAPDPAPASGGEAPAQDAAQSRAASAQRPSATPPREATGASGAQGGASEAGSGDTTNTPPQAPET